MNYDNDPEPGPTPRERALHNEVARLREELAATKASLLFHCREADSYVRQLAAERAAHEATKAAQPTTSRRSRGRAE